MPWALMVDFVSVPENTGRLKIMEDTTKTQIIILVLGVLIGASGYLVNSLFLWETSLSQDRSDTAEGLYLDVSSMEDYLISLDQGFLANPDEKYIFVQAAPIYPDNGLYFAYQRDIPKMDRKIAQDTVTFYNHLLTAERARDRIFEIQRLGDVRELTSAERTRQQTLTGNIAIEVNTSVKLLPALKKELDSAVS
jgi:hypothetical protein